MPSLKKEGTLMKVSEIDLEYVKKYLNADDDYLRLQQHLSSAKDLVMKANGYTTEIELDQVEYLADVVLVYVEQLYDTGKVVDNKAFNNLLTMDRRF